MHDVNWWLAALSFLLGLLLTLAMMIRKVTREVPVARPAPTRPVAAAAAGAAAALHAAADTVGVKVDRVEQKVTRNAERIEQVLEAEPYGAGSIRVAKGGAAPAGYTVKGDKDTGRYFTTDSPEYSVIEAEVWFADEASAAKAGFLRWDAGGESPELGAAAAVVTEDHSHSDTTMVITGGDTLPPEARITIISRDPD